MKKERSSRVSVTTVTGKVVYTEIWNLQPALFKSKLESFCS